MFTLIIQPEAEYDIQQHFMLYERLVPGLGRDFLSCVEEALERIRCFPLIYKLAHDDFRLASIRRFPYRILYFIDGDRTIVTAVFHVRNDPDAWISHSNNKVNSKEPVIYAFK